MSNTQRWQIWVQAGDAFWQLQVRNLLDYVLQVRNLLDYILQVTTDYILHTDYVLQVRNLLTIYYKLELTMYYYCVWYDKLWGPSQRVVTLFSVTLHCSRSCHQEKKYNLYKPRPLEQLKWRRRRESKEISWFCLRCWRPGGQGGNRKGTEGISVPHQLGRGASGTWNVRNCTGEELYFEVTLLARCRRCVAIFLGSC